MWVGHVYSATIIFPISSSLEVPSQNGVEKSFIYCFSPFLGRKRKIRKYLTCFSVAEKKKKFDLSPPSPGKFLALVSSSLGNLQ